MFLFLPSFIEHGGQRNTVIMYTPVYIRSRPTVIIFAILLFSIYFITCFKECNDSCSISNRNKSRENV